MVDIYRDAKRRGVYPPLFTVAEGASCFSIYQIRWIKKRFFNFFFWNFRETRRHFSLRSQNSEYPRMFQIKGANQNGRKLLSTDLVNTNLKWTVLMFLFLPYFFVFCVYDIIRVHLRKRMDFWRRPKNHGSCTSTCRVSTLHAGCERKKLDNEGRATKYSFYESGERDAQLSSWNL